MTAYNGDVQEWFANIYRKMIKRLIIGPTICNMLHLLIVTYGAAILINQDIHKVRVPVMTC